MHILLDRIAQRQSYLFPTVLASPVQSHSDPTVLSLFLLSTCLILVAGCVYRPKPIIKPRSTSLVYITRRAQPRVEYPPGAELRALSVYQIEDDTLHKQDTAETVLSESTNTPLPLEIQQPVESPVDVESFVCHSTQSKQDEVELYLPGSGYMPELLYPMVQSDYVASEGQMIHMYPPDPTNEHPLL